MTSFRRLSKITSLPTPAVSDVVACEIDRAVSELSLHDPKASSAVVGFYLFGLPEYKLARKPHCRREKVEGLLRRGITFVCDRLTSDE